MSLDSLRTSAAAAKRNELQNAEVSRKRKLRELYTISAACIQTTHPPTFDLDAPPDPHELRFLDQNDVAKGRYFQDSSLPFPKLLAQAAQAPQKLPSGKPHEPLQPSATNESAQTDGRRAISVNGAPGDVSEDARASTIALPKPPQSQLQVTAKLGAASQDPTNPANHLAGSVQPVREAKSPESAVKARALPDGPSVNPTKTSSNAPEELADLAASFDPKDDTRLHQKPAAVVHLPPREVQERHVREVTIAQERAAQRNKRDDEHLTVAFDSGNGEVASSPSSTVGPYSANTSRQEQHSPTTSPDEDSNSNRHDIRFDRRSVAKDANDLGRTRRNRAEELARDSSPATPDAQLRLEEEQATRFARDSMKDLDPSGRVGSDGLAPHAADLTERASTVVEESKRAEDIDRTDSTTDVPMLPVDTATVAVNGTSTKVDNHTATKGTPETATRHSSVAESHATRAAELESNADTEMRDAGHPLNRNPEVSSPQDNAEQAGVDDAKDRIAKSTRVATEPLTARQLETRDEERSKLSTVIFAKHDNPFTSKSMQPTSGAYAALKGAAEDPDRDYLIGMFDFQAHSGPQLSCRELLEKATKTFTTANKYASIREVQDYKILKRVYTLQHANKWSLRQIDKSAEPPTKATHHDHLLAEMKWMRTDFREERKWRTAVAKNLAEWCAQWVRSSPEKRRSLQVRARPSTKFEVEHANEEEVESPPELIPSGAHETESESFPDDEDLSDFARAFPPAALFSLGFGDVVAKVDNTPISEKVLDELPQYESRLRGSPGPAGWGPSNKEGGIMPVSKLLTSKLVPKATEPPRKRSRYEYDEEDDSLGYTSKRPTSERSNASTPSLRFSRVGLSPEQTNVALFLPENKHVRDRLHAGHSFRPPSAFPMPSTGFFESRAPSQWLWDEDQKLRQLVKEYSFNWSLVAASLEQPSLFTSGGERRTPWECFERWVQLEGLPGDMAKTPYFRAYQQRLEAAQRTVSAQYQAAQQAQQAAQTPGQMINTPRRRTAQPIRVERRRNNRFLALIDAMRKQARKRESTAHKQAENAKAAALRKAHEATPVRQSVHTPQEFSRLRHDRDQKIQEKYELHRQLTARQNLQRPGPMMAQQAVPGGMTQQARNGTPNNAHGQANLGTGASQNGHVAGGINMQARSHPQNMPNGIAGMPMNVQSMPQAQMQMNMQGQRLQPHTPHTDPNLRMAMQQRNLTQQQQYALQQQQMSRAASMSQMGQANGNIQSPAIMPPSMGAPKANGAGVPPGSSASPRLSNHAAQPQALSSGHVPQITNVAHEIQLANPQMSPQEVNRLAAERINQKMSMQTARQNAMNAAAGAAAAGAQAANAHMTPSPYQQNASLATGSASPSNQAQYQQQMRQHMMQPRTQQGSPVLGANGMNGRPDSRSATPQNPQMGQQGSPRGPPAQVGSR